MSGPERRLEPHHVIKPLLSAVLAALVAAIPAHADKGPAGDDPGDNYLFVLRSEGITWRSNSEAIEGGMGWCSNIARGVKPRALMAEQARLAPVLSAHQAEVIVDSAVTWLCPQYIRWYLANR